MFLPKLSPKVTKDLPIEGHNALVVIQHIKPGVLNKIIQSTLKVSAKTSQNGEMESHVDFNMHDRNVLIVKECVIGWTGFKDEEDKPMKFSQVNLDRMIDESDEFVNWIVAEHEKFSAEVIEEQEEASKN